VAAAALAAMKILAGGAEARADVLLSNFESGGPGGTLGGWHAYTGQNSGLGLTINPAGGTSRWLTIGWKSTADAGGGWTTGGPTIQGDSPGFTNANFQANNFLQFDLIFPSAASAGANAWLSNDAALPIVIKTNTTSSTEVITQLGTVDTSVKDAAIHVILNYGGFKSSNGGSLQVNTNFMNLEFGHFDETAWGATNPTPQVYMDNVYFTLTNTPVVQPPPENDGTWDVTKSGDWVNAGNTNWVGGVAANGATHTATFGSSTAPRTVNVNTGITLGTISLNSANGYSISGTAINLGGTSPTIDVGTGSHTISGIGVSSNATFNVAASSSLTINSFSTGGFGAVNKTGPGAMTVNQINFVSLGVADGTFTMTAPPANGFIFGLTAAAATSYIDLGNAPAWRANSVNGDGVIRVGGGLLTALFSDYSFNGVLTGPGSLSVGSLTEGDADHVATWTNDNTFTGGVTVYRGTLVAKNLRNGQLTINDPTAATGTVSQVQISAKTTPNDPSGTSVVTSLTINSNAKLDLTNNSMVVDYTGPVGTLVGDTRQNILAGKITTTSGTPLIGLGYANNAVLSPVKSSFGGLTVDASSILIKYTYFGDADVDGDVDVADLGALATNWQTASVWSGGDFDYNGTVDVNDLGLLASNWQAGVGSPLGPSLQEALAAVGLGSVAVPEPTSCGLLGLAVWTLTRRRR
jgi:hypothetical protein